MESRERLVGLLWSESPEEKARASLRQSLHELRTAFDAVGFRGFRAEKLTISLNSAAVRVDVWEAVRNAERQRVDPLLLNLPRITDQLLDGYDDIDPSFRIWLLARRQSLQDRLLRALEAGLSDTGVEADSSMHFAEAIINLDPTHEDACRQIMRIRAQAGDTAGALRAYKSLWDLLDDEYGMEPSAKTQQLVADVKNGAFDVAPAPSVASAEPGPQTALPAALVPVATLQPRRQDAPVRIALVVEPFFMEGIAAEQAHLVHGFRHLLIACLVRFREWNVAERPHPADAHFGGTGVNARYAVQATAYENGEQVNVIITLKEIDTDLFIWSDRLELRLGYWFEAQQRVVQRITMALNVHLSAERLMRLAGEPDVPPTLYDRWLRGQAMILSFKPADWQEAAAIFRDVIRQAPNFAPAYSSLAQLGNILHIAHPGLYRTANRQQENLSLARTAAELDPIDSRAQLCLGWAYAFDQQYEHALLNFGLACDLNDNDPWTLVSAAHAHAFLAEFDQAQRLAQKALETALVPSLTHWGYHVALRFLCGDYEGAADAASRSGDTISNTRAWKAAALYHLGRHEAAREEAAMFLRLIRSGWHGEQPPSDAAIGRWLLHLFPIRHAADWERLRQGLAGAGVPVEDVRFEDIRSPLPDGDQAQFEIV